MLFNFNCARNEVNHVKLTSNPDRSTFGPISLAQSPSLSGASVNVARKMRICTIRRQETARNLHRDTYLN